MIKYHPHQNVYFNVLPGDDLRHKFDLDYSGLSFKQALAYVLENDNSSKIKIKSAEREYWSETNIWTFPPQERERINFVKDVQKADYFISAFRLKKDFKYEKEFYSIKVKGETIVIVYKLK